MNQQTPVIPALQISNDHDFSDRPFIVFWEVTKACALACEHCRASANSRGHPDELDRTDSRKLIDQLASLQPSMLILTGGDPLMRNDIIELISYATDSGLHVGLSPAATNRLVLADFNLLKAAGVKRMSLSLDGASSETHDAFRGIKGTYNRTLLAVEKAHEAGISLQINTTLTRSNVHEYDDFKRLMFQLKPAMWSVFLLIPTGRAQLDELPDGEDVERIFEDLADLVGNAPFAVKTTEGHHFRRVLIQRRGTAFAKGRPGMRSPLGIRDGKGSMFISHRGEVMPSGFLPIVCGNVRERSPAEIYRNSPMFRSLRDDDAMGGKCGLCEFRKVCGGSRSRAYGVFGDPFAHDPACVYIPKILRNIPQYND